MRLTSTYKIPTLLAVLAIGFSASIQNTNAQGASGQSTVDSYTKPANDAKRADEAAKVKGSKGAPAPKVEAPKGAAPTIKMKVDAAKGAAAAGKLLEESTEACPIPTANPSSATARITPAVQRANELEGRLAEGFDLNGNRNDNTLDTSYFDAASEANQMVNEYVLEKLEETRPIVMDYLINGNDAKLNAKFEEFSKGISEDRASNDAKRKLQADINEANLAKLKAYAANLKSEITAELSKTSPDSKKVNALEQKAMLLAFYASDYGGLGKLQFNGNEIEDAENCLVAFGWKPKGKLN